ncbi:MAG: TIR domain-containing protein [Methanolobus sp.]|nr:TIR domain-containing protein [Methanolobus sp.]
MNISESTRSDIIDYLLMREQQFHGKLGIIDFLNRIWNLSSLPSTDHRLTNMEADIYQHMISFDDWSYHTLLYDSRLNLLRCNNNIFIKFLETCAHPLVFYKKEQQDELVSTLNSFLDSESLKLEAFGTPEYESIIYKLVSIGDDTSNDEDSYEVVLSFAGEDRDYVQAVAECLMENDVSFFYDMYEQATLWGKDLYEHLAKVYRGNARYCIMFISENYKDKLWTTHERRNAFAKAFTEREEYILPARFDKTEIDGLRHTIGYINLNKYEPQEFTGLILEKLGRKK